MIRGSHIVSFLRNISKISHTRKLSNIMSTENINMNIDDESGVATMIMCRKPVNSLSLEMFTDMIIALEKLENDKNIRALILGSDIPNIFSAGVDIHEMYKPNLARLEQFWRTFQTLWINLYGSRLPVIASISGNSPAGGTLLAMSCDYRIMAQGNFSIGLNGTKLGIVTPSWFRDTLANTISTRQTELILQLGEMYNVDRALHFGLIDRIAPIDDMQSVCHKEAIKWTKIPETARILTKEAMRRDTINRLEVTREHDLETFVNLITKTSTQLNIEKHLQSLKKRKLL